MPEVGDILGGVFNFGSAGKWLPFIFISMICILVIVWAWFRSKKRPKKIATVFFNRVGDAYRPTAGHVLKYDTKKKKGYFVPGGERNLTISLEADAYLNNKGKPVFYLMQIEDTYLPLKMDMEIVIEKITKGKGKDAKTTTKKVKVSHFWAEADLVALDTAAVESIERDAETFAWVDKALPYLLIGTQILGLLMVFLVGFMMYRKIGDSTAEIHAVGAEITGLKNDFNRIANSFEKIGLYYETAAPPPG